MTRSQMLACTALAAFALMGSEACLAHASTLSKAARTSDSMEPALSFPAQEQAAQSKLGALRAKTGRRPNIVWLPDRRHGLWRSVFSSRFCGVNTLQHRIL
jgi:hypothetical protein